MKEAKEILGYVIVGMVIGIVFWLFGRRDGIQSSAVIPQTQIDTVIKYDTIIKYIYKDKYSIKFDTVLKYDTISTPVDTSAIVEDYLSANVFTREWQDSLLWISLTDTICQNIPTSSSIAYKLFKADTTINQIVAYPKNDPGKYLYLGLNTNSSDLNLTGAELTFATPGWYGGVGYIPGIKGISVKAGIKLFKFKGNGNNN